MDDDDIFLRLNEIFTAMSDASCSNEDRENYEFFLNELIQDPESIYIFIQFLMNESNSEQADFYAFAGLKKMIKYYWHSLTEEECMSIIEKLTLLLFTEKKVSSLVCSLFYSKIKSESFSPLWSEIFEMCQNELSQENVSIEKVSIVIENVYYLSVLIKNFFGNQPISSDFLEQFDEITSPFFDVELLNSESGLTILQNSIKSFVNLFGRSLAIESNEYVKQRICELCQFFIQIYESIKTISEFNDQLLNFFKSCSSVILSILVSSHNFQSYEEEMDDYLEYILNEWQPQILSILYDLGLAIFTADSSKQYDVSRIIQPLTFYGGTRDSIQTIFLSAIQFLDIQKDDLYYFYYNPEIFYESQYCMYSDEINNLRMNTALIYQNIFSNLEKVQIDYLFENVIHITEAEIFMVAKNVKRIVNNGSSESLLHYIDSIFGYYLRCEEKDPFILASAFYLYSKSIRVIPFRKIQLFVNFILTILNHYLNVPYMRVIVMVCVRFLYKLKKVINSKLDDVNDDLEVEWGIEMIPADDVKAIFPDEVVVDILFQLIENDVTSNVFSLFELIANDYEEVYPLLVNLYEPLLRGIMDEMINCQTIDSSIALEKSQLNLESMFSLLTRIIEYNTDSGVEEELYKVLTVCLKMSSLFDIADEVIKIITVLVKQNSELSKFYLKRILSFIIKNNYRNVDIDDDEEQEEEEMEEVDSIIDDYDNLIFRRRVLNYSIPFLFFISQFPTEFAESEMLILTYKTLVNVMNENIVIDIADDLGLVVLLAWIFQLQPQIILDEQRQQANQSDDEFLTLDPSFFFSYLESHKDEDENSINSYESMILNLALTFVLIEKIDLNEEFLQRWITYIGNHYFLREVDLRFHKLALNYFINQGTFSEIFKDDNEIENIAIGLLKQMESEPDEFLVEIKSSDVDLIMMSNIDYPILTMLQE